LGRGGKYCNSQRRSNVLGKEKEEAEEGSKWTRFSFKREKKEELVYGGEKYLDFDWKRTEDK